jgi:hypothetical protein
MWTPRRLAPVALFALLLPLPALAQQGASGTIPPGTVLTQENWQQYKAFMPTALQGMWEGTFGGWKFPPDFQMPVGATHHYPPPPQFLKYTEQYSPQVRIVTLPNGRHILQNYVAGLPFPNPQEPMKGWKILANDWYAYVPAIICNDSVGQVFRDREGNVTSNLSIVSLHIYDHVADPGMPIQDPNNADLYYTEFFELVAPEQARYTAILTVYYRDQTKDEDTFIFVPALRRTLRLSSTARCSPVFGSDATNDDTRHGAFNGNITKFDAQFLGDQKVLVQPNPDNAKSGFLENFEAPFFFPKPTANIGDWEVRDAYVIDARHIPSLAAGYCYGKRVMYCDKESSNAKWAELYDANMKFWKIFYDPQSLIQVPGVGRYWTNGGWGELFDVQNQHLTWVHLSGPTGPFRANADCRNVNGVDLTDPTRYGSVRGLSEIMR